MIFKNKDIIPSLPTERNGGLKAVEGLKTRCGIGGTIPELRREDIPFLARHAGREANPLYPVPVLMDARELEELCHRLQKDVLPKTRSKNINGYEFENKKLLEILLTRGNVWRILKIKEGERKIFDF